MKFINFHCFTAIGKILFSFLIVAYPLATLAAEPAKPTIEIKPDPAVHLVKFPKKNSREAALIRGEIAFSRYCVLCHGVNADGKGRAAKLYDPKPANLRLSDKNTLYKTMIVSKGGAAMARSPSMPRWDQELTTEQITDIVMYLNSIAEHPPIN